MQAVVCKVPFQKATYDSIESYICPNDQYGQVFTTEAYQVVDVQALPVVYTSSDYQALSAFVLTCFVVAFGVRMMLKIFSGTQKT